MGLRKYLCSDGVLEDMFALELMQSIERCETLIHVCFTACVLLVVELLLFSYSLIKLYDYYRTVILKLIVWLLINIKYNENDI